MANIQYPFQFFLERKGEKFYFFVHLEWKPQNLLHMHTLESFTWLLHIHTLAVKKMPAGLYNFEAQYFCVSSSVILLIRSCIFWPLCVQLHTLWHSLKHSALELSTMNNIGFKSGISFKTICWMTGRFNWAKTLAMIT